MLSAFRAAARPALRVAAARPAAVRLAHGHAQESFEQFSQRYVTFFQNAEDLFEVQRGLNNCFAHDLVPSPQVVEAAVRAARRVDDYATAVRVFEGVSEKVENKAQYQAYLDELKGLREELGMSKPSVYRVVVLSRPRHPDQGGVVPESIIDWAIYPPSFNQQLAQSHVMHPMHCVASEESQSLIDIPSFPIGSPKINNLQCPDSRRAPDVMCAYDSDRFGYRVLDLIR